MGAEDHQVDFALVDLRQDLLARPADADAPADRFHTLQLGEGAVELVQGQTLDLPSLITAATGRPASTIACMLLPRPEIRITILVMSTF